MMALYAVIESCWVIFVLFWLISAFFTKRSIEKENIVKRLAYIIPVLIAYFLIFEGINNKQFQYLNILFIPNTLCTMIIGVLSTVLGLLLTLWARISLGTNWSGTVTFKENHKLIERGPYAFVRHPIYSGILLMSLGTVIFAGNVVGLIGLILLFVSFWIKLKQEEKLMIKHFKGKYVAYKRRTNALIPHLL